MHSDVLRSGLEKLGNGRLRQPNASLLETNGKPRLPGLTAVENNFTAHAVASLGNARVDGGLQS